MKIKKKHKKCVLKRKLNFKDYEHYLQATQLENKINHSKKKKKKKILVNNGDVLVNKMHMQNPVLC